MNKLEVENWEFLGDIDDHLDLIFNSKKKKWSSLSNRRDVINKTILRGFKKFFVELFDTQKLKINKSFKPSIKASESYVLERAKYYGMYDYNWAQENVNDYESFIYWLSFPKITQKVMRLSTSKLSAINVFHDLLMSYSHQKLDMIFENKVIMSIFKYFITFGKDKFMQEIEVTKSAAQNSSNITKNE